jgi:hypothetical protein
VACSPLFVERPAGGLVGRGLPNDAFGGCEFLNVGVWRNNAGDSGSEAVVVGVVIVGDRATTHIVDLHLDLSRGFVNPELDSDAHRYRLVISKVMSR